MCDIAPYPRFLWIKPWRTLYRHAKASIYAAFQLMLKKGARNPAVGNGRHCQPQPRPMSCIRKENVPHAADCSIGRTIFSGIRSRQCFAMFL